MSIRRRVWQILTAATRGDRVSLIFDISLVTLILLNVVMLVLETVESIHAHAAGLFAWGEWVSVGVFTAEYLLRVWSCVEDPRYSSPIKGRIRFALSFMAIVDLLAVLPAFLPLLNLDLRVLRVLRVLRLLRVLKLGRYSQSMQLLLRVVTLIRYELASTLTILLFLVLIAATMMYYAEHEAQPDRFSSIPAAMWWALITLTTVGYGDTFPVTVAGRIIASVISVLGIGMVALPAGILGSAFVEELRERRRSTASAKSDRNGGASSS